MALVAFERPIRGEGETPEADWRAWLADFAAPALPARYLPAAEGRLVVVAPHPDDEILGCGGLLAWHLGRGGPALVVAVTDGEASHRGDPSWPPLRLGAQRRQESRRGLARLGVAADAVVRLGLPDGAVGAHASALEDALGALLNAGDIVVSTWHLDGHPDHDATGTAVRRWAAERGAPILQAPVWMWHWSAPGDPRVPWRHLHALPLTAACVAVKTQALAEHETQLRPRPANAGPVLGTAIQARAARGAEYFFIE